MKKTFNKTLLTLSLLGMLAPATVGMAEDIDIYKSSSADADKPNILVVIDNSANWASASQHWPGGIKQGQAELSALRTVISDLNEDVKLGLMLFTPGSGSKKDGGYVRFNIRKMDSTNKSAFQAMLGNPAGCTDGLNSLNNTPNCIYQNFSSGSLNESVGTAKTDYSATLFEVFKYFGGYTCPAHADDGVARCSTGSDGASYYGAYRYAGDPEPRADYQAYEQTCGASDPESCADTPRTDLTYHTPLSGSQSCAKNFVIFIGNGLPNQDSPASLLTGVGGDATQLPLPNLTGSPMVPTGTYTTPTGSAIRYADEWARFLNKTDLSGATGQQNAITYTIDVFKDAQDANQTKLLMSMASAGGGKYFTASDEEAIKSALRKIFAEIQSVNSVFASSSLPVSVNTQGTYLNQVFMGMFRPDGGAKPRWAGNLKQYKFKVFADGVLRLSDKNGEAALSSTTGFIAPCTNSFWSTDSGSYWDFGPRTAKGSCTAQPSAFYSDAPDGDVVEKGGAAQRLRGVSGATRSTNYLTRALKTCDGSTTTSCIAFTDFSTSAITAAAGATLFGVPVADAHNLINWVRGQDLMNENDNSSGGVAITNEMRPSAHGGVIHSQPAVVDYGGTTGVVAFYGADDGVFHAIDGGMTDTEGTELWGFIPPEAFGRLNRLKDNGATTSLIPYPADPFNAASAGAGVRKDYFFDGGIGVYQKSGTVWIFPSMRRGGRAVYAFDVTAPASPTLKWRRGCFTNDTASTNCSTGWSGIGQTWSKPTLAYLSGYTSGGNPKPVLIFGGGYDQCEDSNKSDSSGCGTKGAQVWFVDADTGAIIRTYPTHGSVPGDISLVNDTSGNVKYVYAADTKGYVYRINAGSYDGTTFGASWSGTTLGDTDIARMSTDQPRKFLSGPDVVPYATFNAVLIGSGDREHPLKDSYACGNFSGGVQNQFYMLMDQPNASPAPALVESGSTFPAIGLVDVTTGVSTKALSGSTTTLTNVRGGVTTTSTRGWRFNFGQCEQSVNKPLTIGGVTYFGTNAPSPTTAACQANIGIARGYAVDFETGNPVGNERFAAFTGGGMPPSPAFAVPDVDGEKLPIIIGVNTGAASPSPFQGTEITIEPTGARTRMYWYIQTD